MQPRAIVCCGMSHHHGGGELVEPDHRREHPVFLRRVEAEHAFGVGKALGGREARPMIDDGDEPSRHGGEANHRDRVRAGAADEQPCRVPDAQLGQPVDLGAQCVAGQGLEMHVDHSLAAHAETEHAVVRPRVVVRELRPARGEHLCGARDDVRLEAAATHRAGRGSVGADDHPRAGTAVRRPVHADDRGDHRALAAAGGIDEREPNAIELVHEPTRVGAPGSSA